MKDLSIIIPIFNEQENIALLFERLNVVISKITGQSEYIFINDGSTDNSISIIKSLAAIHQNIKFIDFSRNFGHQVAVTAGLDHCSGKAVVIIDADLQDPPELIGQLYEKWKEGYEVVYAQRRIRNGENFLKKTTARTFYRLLRKITSVEIPVDTGDFRLIDQKIVKVLRQMP